jgi:hypothetical protein
VISPDNLLVQGFWSGPLTTMERLSMQSFLYWGHRYALYCYEEPAGVPAGVEVRDAREIIPESEVKTFRCAQQFSDFFRIALLYKRGGYYSDLDNIALKFMDFDSPYVFYRDHDESTISFALSKAPAGSELMTHCYTYLSQMAADERARLSWQEIGAEFAQGAVEYFHMTDYAQPGYVFDSIHHTRVRDLVSPSPEPLFDLSKSYSVHLFHAAWNSGPIDRTGKGFNLDLPQGEKLDTDATYPSDCLYERLKRRYL